MGRVMNDWVTAASLWLQALAILVVVAILATALDRKPPFRILPHDPVRIKAGTFVAIEVPVWRDLSRHCDVKYDRYLFDGVGWRFDLSAGAYASDASIRQWDATTPGKMRIQFEAPHAWSNLNSGGLVPGLGSIVADLRYYCAKGHYLFPIEMTTVIPIVIEP